MIKNETENSAAIKWLANPPPGSKAAAARDFGIDLSLNIENLKLTPTQRLQALQGAMRGLEQIRNSLKLR